MWKALELVALGTYQLEYVWVLLVRHDARTGGTLLRQLDETEVLTVEHAGIESHLCQRSCHGSHGESHIALHLATSHLCIYHVVIHAVETEQLGSHGTVERETATIACRTSERVAVGHAISCLQEKHIICKALSIGTKPKSEG